MITMQSVKQEITEAEQLDVYKRQIVHSINVNGQYIFRTVGDEAERHLGTAGELGAFGTVSYTHLDVYKRQIVNISNWRPMKATTIGRRRR